MALVVTACGHRARLYPGLCRSIHWRLGCAGIHPQCAARNTFVDGPGPGPVHLFQSCPLCIRPRGFSSSTATRVFAVQACSRSARAVSRDRVLDTDSRSLRIKVCGDNRGTAVDVLSGVCDLQRTGDDRCARSVADDGGSDRSFARTATAKGLAGYSWRGAVGRGSKSTRDGRLLWSMADLRAVCLRMAAKSPGIIACRLVVRGLSDLRGLWLCLLVPLRSELPLRLAWLARIDACRIRFASGQHPQRLALVAFLSGYIAAGAARFANGFRFGMATPQALSDSAARRRGIVCQPALAAELQHDHRLALPFDWIAGALAALFALSLSISNAAAGNRAARVCLHGGGNRFDWRFFRRVLMADTQRVCESKSCVEGI